MKLISFLLLCFSLHSYAASGLGANILCHRGGNGIIWVDVDTQTLSFEKLLEPGQEERAREVMGLDAPLEKTTGFYRKRSARFLTGDDQEMIADGILVLDAAAFASAKLELSEGHGETETGSMVLHGVLEVVLTDIFSDSNYPFLDPEEKIASGEIIRFIEQVRCEVSR